MATVTCYARVLGRRHRRAGAWPSRLHVVMVRCVVFTRRRRRGAGVMGDVVHRRSGVSSSGALPGTRGWRVVLSRRRRARCFARFVRSRWRVVLGRRRSRGLGLVAVRFFPSLGATTRSSFWWTAAPLGIRESIVSRLPPRVRVICPSFGIHRHLRACASGSKIEEGFASNFDGGVRSPFHDQPLGFSLEKFKMTPAEL